MPKTTGVIHRELGDENFIFLLRTDEMLAHRCLLFCWYNTTVYISMPKTTGEMKREIGDNNFIFLLMTDKNTWP